MLRLNQRLVADRASPDNVTVHLSSYSRMKGISNLVPDTSLAIFSKDESFTSAEQYTVFDYLVTENPTVYRRDFEVTQTVKGWDGVSFQLNPWKQILRRGERRSLRKRPGESWSDTLWRLLPLRPRFSEQVWVMRKKQDSQRTSHW